MREAPAATPEPPYWAVVFTSVRTAHDPEGYAEAARRMLELAAAQPGFLGAESVRGDDGVGITVSYWDSPEAIAAWRQHPEHRAVQQDGARHWYARYAIRVCRVERALGGGGESP